MLAELRGLNEECGVFGIGVMKTRRIGLWSARCSTGDEGAGIVTKEGKKFHVIKGEGLVNEVFSGNEINDLKGNAAIGQVRYSTEMAVGSKMFSPLFSFYNR